MEVRYCPWCFGKTRGRFCREPGCNGAVPRSLEDVDPFERHPFSGFFVDWRYRVTKQVVIGGYGAVYRAYDRFADLMVAIKFLCEGPRAIVDPAVRRKFEREATILGRLRHSNIVALYDVEGIQEGPPCLIMELLRGSDLERHLRDRRLLPPHDAIQWLLPVCAALGFAHGEGFLHLDIKPSNIFRHRGRDGAEVIKVLDFGIARIMGDRHPQRSEFEGKIVYGTPQYVAPEVAMGRAPTAASDLYSVGVVLYEALSGWPPFNGTSNTDILNAHVRSQVPPLPTRPDLPQALRDLVSSLLEKAPERRPRSAAEVGERLESILRDLSDPPTLGSPPTVPGGGATDARCVPTPTGRESAVNACKIYMIDMFSRRQNVLLFLAALVLGVLFGIGIARAANRPGTLQPAGDPDHPALIFDAVPQNCVSKPCDSPVVNHHRRDPARQSPH